MHTHIHTIIIIIITQRNHLYSNAYVPDTILSPSIYIKILILKNELVAIIFSIEMRKMIAIPDSKAFRD